MVDEVGGAGGTAGEAVRGSAGAPSTRHAGCSPQPMDSLPGSRESLPLAAGGIDRRALLAAFLGGGALAFGGLVRRPVIPLWRPADGPPAPAALFSDDERRTLGAVLDTFWPPGADVPSMADVGGAAYVEAVLASKDVDPREAPATKAGFARLHAVSASRGAARFEALAPVDRDSVLRTVAQEEAGGPFVAMLLAYAMEALFGDPIHGGNRGGAGWQWARYEPATPRLTSLPRREAK